MPRKGEHQTEAAKMAIKLALIGKPKTEGHRTKLCGLVRSEEHCRHLSEALKGRISPTQGKHLSEAIRDKLGQARRGKALTDEHRQHIKDGVKRALLEGKKNPGRPWTEEIRQRMISINKGNRYSVGRNLSAAHRAKISRSLLGNKRAIGNIMSPEGRERQRLGVAKWLERWPKPPTKLEIALYRFLEMAAYDYCPQKRFGPYVVDAFVPEANLIFEADGSFWHQDKNREQKRDSYLQHHAKAIVHLTENDLLPLIWSMENLI